MCKTSFGKVDIRMHVHRFLSRLNGDIERIYQAPRSSTSFTKIKPSGTQNLWRWSLYLSAACMHWIHIQAAWLRWLHARNFLIQLRHFDCHSNMYIHPQLIQMILCNKILKNSKDIFTVYFMHTHTHVTHMCGVLYHWPLIYIIWPFWVSDHHYGGLTFIQPSLCEAEFPAYWSHVVDEREYNRQRRLICKAVEM